MCPVGSTVTGEAPAAQRMFVALWPDDEVRGRLAELLERCADQVGGRPVPRDNLHLTLAFLGDLIPPQITAVTGCLDALPSLCAELRLDRVGYWPKTGLVWVGSSVVDPSLAALVSELKRCLARLGFKPDTREFKPHVTLLRRAPRRVRVQSPNIHWPVSEVTLVRSTLGTRGSVYRVVGRWAG